MKFQASFATRLCRHCARHDAKFTFRGRVKRDRDHDICHRCYRSLRDRNFALQLSASEHERVFNLALGPFYCQLLEQPWRRGARVA